ncbi:MAG: hypothetical protein SFU56_12915 [Capsulimonadales bacterium]|nr:hypothetical protein [Capsulimonadales bacterium]
MEETNESQPAPKAGKRITRAKEKENGLPSVPYNRVDDPAVRGTYRAKTYDLLQALTGGQRGVAGSSYMVSLAQCFAEAVALPHDPTPTHKELEALYDDVDADVDTAPFFDGGRRRIEQYEGFTETTGNWRAHGVGDVRSLYFFAVLAINDFGHDGDEDPLRMGGFPPTPHGIVGVRRLVARSGHRVGPRASEWLAYDAYLGDGLKHLGVEWLDIEDAVTAAFLGSIPKQYRALLDAQDVPRPLSLILWRHDFERWQAVISHAAAILKVEKALSAALCPLPFAPLLGSGVEDVPAMLTRLRQVVTVPEWQVVTVPKWADAATWRLPDFKKVNPPTVRPVYRAIADTLADRIGGLSRAAVPPDDAPVFAHRLFASMAGSGGENGRQSRDFLSLVADILFHLAVARGYPSAYCPDGSLQSPTFHDWKNVRYLLAEQE